MPLIAIVDERYGRLDLSFRRGGLMGSAPLQTRFGPVELIFGETYDRVDGQSARVALRMIAYQYAVKLIGTDEPLLRWEFVQFPGDRSYWCRNHLQGPVTVSVGGRAISLNDWHLPTGPVPIEEIVRFCLVDLGVPPLDTNVDADGTPG